MCETGLKTANLPRVKHSSLFGTECRKNVRLIHRTVILGTVESRNHHDLITAASNVMCVEERRRQL